MVNGSFKKFLQDNAYQLIASFVALVIVIIGFYVSIQLFQYSITQRVSALETTAVSQQQIITTMSTNTAVIQANQTNNAAKLDQIQSDVTAIRNYLLNTNHPTPGQ